jgi:hypothetical protein
LHSGVRRDKHKLAENIPFAEKFFCGVDYFGCGPRSAWPFSEHE